MSRDNKLMSEITILIGGFGSGKTECALRLALDGAKVGRKTSLVDLDIVNPMFRSTVQEEYSARRRRIPYHVRVRE